MTEVSLKITSKKDSLKESGVFCLRGNCLLHFDVNGHYGERHSTCGELFSKYLKGIIAVPPTPVNLLAKERQSQRLVVVRTLQAGHEDYELDILFSFAGDSNITSTANKVSQRQSFGGREVPALDS